MYIPAETQFHALIREAMHANRVTPSDLATRLERHYSYIYNTLRDERGLNLRTAEQLAEGAGYKLMISLEPYPGHPELTVDYDNPPEVFTRRRSKVEIAKSKTKTKTEASEAVRSAAEKEVEELLKEMEKEND